MITKNDIKRFKSKIICPTDIEDCWEINTASLPKGYKIFYWNGSQGYAHRFSYIIFHGNIEPGNCVCHKCDNPGCVNPRHLFQGSLNDNNQDMINKGRMKHTHGENLKTSKLKESDVIDILNLKYNSIDEIVKELNVSRNIPEKLLKGHIWKHITKNYNLETIQKKILYTYYNRPTNIITEDIAKDIKLRLMNNESVKNIANIYNIKRGIVYSIKNGYSWKNV